MRVAALDADRTSVATAVHRALAAHLCRCTGWQHDRRHRSVLRISARSARHPTDRTGGAARRLEGGSAADRSVPHVALGRAGSPTTQRRTDALVAVLRRRRGVARRRDADRGAAAGRQGPGPALDRGADAGRSTCRPGTGTARCRRRGSSPATSSRTPRGARRAASRRRRSPTAARSAARRRARSPPSPGAWPTSTGAPVRVLTHARTSCAAGRSARRSPPACAPTGPASSASPARRASPRAIAAAAPGSRSRRSTSPGPPTSAALRARRLGRSGGAAGVARRRARTPSSRPTAPPRRRRVDDGGVHVHVRCGDPLDEVVLRSYCTGAAHMALGWVRSEGLAVDADGVPGRPDDPLVRHPPRRRHAADHDRDRARRRPAGQRQRRRVRRRRRRGLAPAGYHALAD